MELLSRAIKLGVFLQIALLRACIKSNSKILLLPVFFLFFFPVSLLKESRRDSLRSTSPIETKIAIKLAYYLFSHSILP